MNDKELNHIIKEGSEAPSHEFTDKVMHEISTIEVQVESSINWKFWFILIASAIVLILSIFVKLPNLKYLNYTFEFSSAVIPGFTVIFWVFVFLQLNSITNSLLEFKNNNSN